MGTDGRKGVESFRSVNDVNAVFNIGSGGALRILVRLARVRDRRRFVQHVGREKLIAEHRGSAPYDRDAAETQLHERVAPAVPRGGFFFVCLGFVGHRFFSFVHTFTGFAVSNCTSAGNPVCTRWYASIVITSTGQRAAQRPQRMQRVSSLIMAEPVMMPSSSAATSSSSTR